jgi:oligoendopeptidase F
MTFVPEGTDVTSKEQLDALFLDLEERKIATVAALEKWLLDWSELQAFLSEAESRRYIEMTCHTDDEAVQRRFLDFQNVILPFVKPRWQHLKTIYSASPFRSKLDKKRYHVFDRAVVNEIEIYRDENVPLESKEAELVTKWQSVTGAMTVSWEGQDRTMPQMAALLDETDRSLRERAWRAMYERRLKDRAEIDRLYDEMIRLRVTMSRNAGFHNYRDYMFRVRGRFDYTPDDCRAFHDAVEEFVVPLLRRLHDKRKRDLDVGTLRPWDLNVDPAGAAPLRPFKDVKDLVQGVRDVYHKISPDLARLFEGIRDRGNLDLDSRKGKAPGGYQSTLDVQRVPFIFMNAAGVNRDVMTLLHEGGHAFHAILARTEPLVFYRSAPLEFCEVASMGMEAIGVKHLDVFYPKEADAARARREYFEGIIKIFPWIASIDAFQHWVYLHPGHSRKEREKAWLDLRRKFKGGDDWTGLENEHATSWHLQMHPFCVPFYYIEYAFAQVGALQVWQNARKDADKALASYREGLSLGGSRTLPDLFKATGLKFGLDRKILKPLIKAVEAEL